MGVEDMEKSFFFLDESISMFGQPLHEWDGGDIDIDIEDYIKKI